MNFRLNKYQLEKYSRQIILKDVGALGQKKIIKSKVLIIGMGGLGCPVAEFLTRAGIGNIGIVDFDKVDLSNIHRQSLFNLKDLNKEIVFVESCFLFIITFLLILKKKVKNFYHLYLIYL